MALTPGSYVPQGQVGTGAAYVHQIKDRSGYVEALAAAAKEERIQQEKQMAKIKGFDYGKVIDPVMKQHISEQYKNGLTAFSEIVSKGGDISSVTTPEGIAFSDWQNNIKNEADTAARAESMKDEFRKTVANNIDDYDEEIVNAALSSYDNAKTPDQKLASMVNFDPLYVRGFDYNKWINTQFDNAEKDVEVTKYKGDINKYQEVYNKKIDVLPEVLAVDPGYPIAELQWKRKKEKGEDGFQQENFGEFLTDQIQYQKTLRESKREAIAAKPNIINVNVANKTEPTNVVPTKLEVGTPGYAINFPDLEQAFQVDGKIAADKLAFWAWDKSGIPNLVLKAGSNNPEDYGLDSRVARADESDTNGVYIKGSNLYKLKTDWPGVSFQIDDLSKHKDAFLNKTFRDESGKSTKAYPHLMYRDQLGNLWLDMVDEDKGDRHMIIETGKLSQNYVNKEGQSATSPLAVTANQNKVAFEQAIGMPWDAFKKKYVDNNLR
jgi:hypothetical protein